MTRRPAAHPPGQRVTSRALGDEESVEVDMKTIEVGEGNAFLLCTDGITRHIPDNELRELLQSGRTVEAMCTEMKERCYQRGAEDNLTAIIVQVGTPPQSDFPTIDIERTISNETYASAAQASAATVETPVTPPPLNALPDASETEASQSRATVKSRRRPRGGSAVLRFFVFLLFIGVAGGAFYAGMRYQRGQLFSSQNAAPQPSPTTQPVDAASKFEQ